MRLWHQKLIIHLPAAQLLGQHRECCALRGKGWNRNHRVVNYVFLHEPEHLVAYHYKVMETMTAWGFVVNDTWREVLYRGKNSELWKDFSMILFNRLLNRRFVYPEHDEEYYDSCLMNLRNKGINI